MKNICCLLLCAVLASCVKSPEEKEKFELLVKEYPSLAPAVGAKIELNRCGFDLSGCNLQKIGVFFTDANGIVETDEEFSAKWSRVLEGGGYIPTVLQNDTLQVPEYYVAKPGWVRLNIKNIAPAEADDVCIISFAQTDTMHLSTNTFLHGFDVLDGVFDRDFQGASVDEQFLIRLAGGVSATMYVSYSYGTFYPPIDSVLQIFVPKNDTTFVNFEY